MAVKVDGMLKLINQNLLSAIPNTFRLCITAEGCFGVLGSALTTRVCKWYNRVCWYKCIVYRHHFKEDGLIQGCSVRCSVLAR